MTKVVIVITCGLICLIIGTIYNYSSGYQGALLASLIPGVNIIRMLLLGLGIMKDEGTVKSMSRYNDYRWSFYAYFGWFPSELCFPCRHEATLYLELAPPRAFILCYRSNLTCLSISYEKQSIVLLVKKQVHLTQALHWRDIQDLYNISLRTFKCFCTSAMCVKNDM